MAAVDPLLPFELDRKFTSPSEKICACEGRRSPLGESRGFTLTPE